MTINIAIDGPAGAGKSTIAREVAKTLSFIYVDTGAMYRAIALYVLKKGIDPNDQLSVCENCKFAQIELKYENRKQKVLLNGEDVSTEIREEVVGNAASVVARYDEIRKKLNVLSRRLAETTNVVMDGRDIGTVVLPKAEIKIFLTASVDTRACRRFLELQESGENPSLAEIREDIRQRDYQDMHREQSPLYQASDAILIDSSDMKISEVVDEILDICQKRCQI